MAEHDTMARARYHAALGTAFVAGAFSLVVCAMLVVSFVRGVYDDPLDSDLIGDLKAELAKTPSDEALKGRIRAADLTIRKEHFARREFIAFGAWLLVGGAVVLVVALRLVASYRVRPHHPLRSGEEETPEEVATGRARTSIGAFGIVAAGVALAFILGARVIPLDTSGATRAAPAYPSAEEIARNWPRFRGPGGRGWSARTDVPTRWDGKTGEGILWKSPVPLPGESSPIIWDGRVFLTGATKKKRDVYCFDADTGKLLWRRSVAVPGTSPGAPEVMDDTGYAAPSPATDGSRVAAIFANGDVGCFDFEGNQLWARSLGLPENDYGHASSLATYRGLLIIQLDQGHPEDRKSRLLALDWTSGETVWQARRAVPNSWSSPAIFTAAGREQLVTCANPWVVAYDPATGREIWRAELLGGDVAPSPACAGELVFVTNEGASLAAIRADGRGDVTKTHVAWTAEDDLPDICSPLADGRRVWILTTYGILTCYRASDGTKLYDHDFEKSFTASPSLVGDKLYLLDQRGVTYIVAASDEFDILGTADLGEGATTSPAFAGGRIYIRGKKHLYCIGKKRD